MILSILLTEATLYHTCTCMCVCVCMYINTQLYCILLIQVSFISLCLYSHVYIQVFFIGLFMYSCVYIHVSFQLYRIALRLTLHKLQPIAFGVTFNLNLQSQSPWFFFNGTW